MILLDTCALLWLTSDQEKFSAKAKETIKKNADALFVSSITAFEIAIKYRNGQLALKFPVLEWFSEALNFHGIKEVEVTGSIAISSVLLPQLHSDPCDRIIIATAQLNALKILT